jgi:hypothetical protein
MESCRALVQELPELSKKFKMRKMLIMMNGFTSNSLVDELMTDMDRLRQLLLDIDCKNRAAMLMLADMYDLMKCFSDAYGIRLWVRYLFPSVHIDISPPAVVRFPKHEVTRRRGLTDVLMCVWQGQNSMSMSTSSSVIMYKFVGKQPTPEHAWALDQNVVYITPTDTICYTEVPCHNVLNVRASDIQGHIITLLFFADTLRNREHSREGDDINTGVANYGMVVCSCPVHEPEVMQTHVESIMTKTTSILSYDLRSKSTHVPMRCCNILHIHDAKKFERRGHQPHIVLKRQEELHLEKDFMNCMWLLNHLAL